MCYVPSSFAIPSVKTELDSLLSSSSSLFPSNFKKYSRQGILPACALGVTHVDPNCASTGSFDQWHRYVRALHWAVATLTTVGYGDVTAISQSEMGFSILMFVLGRGMIF